jgi:hypothetical protein
MKQLVMMTEENTATTDIVNEVNKAMDGLLFENKPRVCFCCDRLLMGEHKQKWFKIKLLHEIKAEIVVESLPPELLKDYKYAGEDTPNWIRKIMIPKQSVYDSKSRSFLSCNNCYNFLKTSVTLRTAFVMVSFVDLHLKK